MSDALAGLRVLDLSDASGQYCGKMFSDLGAEVILIEPPDGSRVRRQPPCFEGSDGAKHSLAFAYFNAGKKSVRIDLDTAQGQQQFKELVAMSDLILEAEPPGRMAARGLDFHRLHALKPSLVMTSITPFGQSGPYAGYASDDLILLAAGGMLSLGGYHDSAPIAVAGNHAWLAAAQFAAVASMTALLSSDGAGRCMGRHIDVSVQECVVKGMENAIQFYDLEGVVRKREGGKPRWAGTGVFDCQDGQVYLMAGGIVPDRFREACVRWMMEDGVQGAEVMLQPEWASQDFQMTDAARAHFAGCFGPFARERTKQALYSEAQARRIPLCPINSPADLINSTQLLARGHFVEMMDPLIGKPVQMPGAPYHLSATPWRSRGPAPSVGEHDDLLAEFAQELTA
ncbi:CaiB/BaiF CoA transferase family protein [Caenimonas aquaedulcis]|uniref:CoA transferase n=1 Tax=Caenimonas aquaedulcis TaxID=2793270 RepID=A0A931H8J7_9BURK|nr:CoA transferase [Caenimonas aquaedulcis]MBG9390596.1 CoA transferase [Caenimonas aquaedulcis]